jgi:hypothetical protein
VRLTFDAAMLANKGFVAKPFSVRDLFAAKELGSSFTANFSIHVPTSGVKLVRVTTAKLPATATPS